jgi:hypothetical protein
MKKPKGFNKMTLREQEIWLIAERELINKALLHNSKHLAIVRGGQKVEISDYERPDLEKV